MPSRIHNRFKKKGRYLVSSRSETDRNTHVTFRNNDPPGDPLVDSSVVTSNAAKTLSNNATADRSDLPDLEGIQFKKMQVFILIKMQLQPV